MRRTLSLSVVCLVTLVAACGTEESTSEGSGKPPASMCEAVAPAVPEEWELTKTSAASGKAKTDCTLAASDGSTRGRGHDGRRGGRGQRGLSSG